MLQTFSQPEDYKNKLSTNTDDDDMSKSEASKFEER